MHTHVRAFVRVECFPKIALRFVLLKPNYGETCNTTVQLQVQLQLARAPKKTQQTKTNARETATIQTLQRRNVTNKTITSILHVVTDNIDIIINAM